MSKNKACLPALCVFILLSLVALGNAAALSAYPIEYDFSLQIASGSMQPTLEINDTVYIKNVTRLSEVYASPVNGDIIVFYWLPYDEIAVHRVIEKYQENGTWYFIAKGDNNPGPDYPRQEDYVVGKVVAVQRVLQVESYNVSVFSNSAFVDFHFNSTLNALEFNATLLLTQSAPNGFFNVTVPNGMVSGQLDVLIDGASVNFQLSTNITHQSVWFDVEETSYTGDIVLPEYSTTLVMPLLFTATLLMITLARAKGTRAWS